MIPKPTILIIIDGWGIDGPSSGNAITRANPKYFNYLTKNFPTTLIQASGEAVGVSWGEMGNSEIGHINIGAGRIVYQSLMRITKSIENGNIKKNKAIIAACNYVKKNNSKLHFIGLTSDGGVHSYLGHLYGLLDVVKEEGIKDVFIHAFLDGRDTKYNEGINFISRLNNKMEGIGLGKIATLSGRYYAMDRDNHWERIEKAYRAMAEGVADNYATNPIEAIKKSYDKEIYDEEFIPTVIRDKNKKSLAKIEEKDSVIFFNFRPDRAREITKAFILPSFDKFQRKYFELEFITLTEYEKKLPVKIAFTRKEIVNTLGEIISLQELKQLHIAETEKYAHITYFLNGGTEKPFLGEDNVIIPSPRVSSYAQAPEMSAKLVTKRVVNEIIKGKYDFIAINFANVDMVGHTGNIEAAIKAVKSVDASLKEIVELTLIKDGCVVITADHGNAEDMINERIGEIEKGHTSNPVPLLIIKKDFYGQKIGVLSPVENDLSMVRPTGVLADVAPTILKIMEIKKPKEMQGIFLF